VTETDCARPSIHHAIFRVLSEACVESHLTVQRYATFKVAAMASGKQWPDSSIYIMTHLLPGFGLSARSLFCDSNVFLRQAPRCSPSSITTITVLLPHSPIHSSSLTMYEQQVSTSRPWPSMRTAPWSRNIWQSRKHGRLIRRPQTVRGRLGDCPALNSVHSPLS
jgi:hypothetical protein